MPSQSMLVIEDIDCSIKLQNRESEDASENQSEKQGDNKVTLSGLLDFIDGLWSCCGEKLTIIFTTNHKEKLDPAGIAETWADGYAYSNVMLQRICDKRTCLQLPVD